ncbi:MAG: hypothetical protein GY757_41190 [bacterium]|nr:hypothetical protein [bacterium]
MLTDENLTYRKIFVFWYPLAAAWLLMAVEGPYLQAIIARLAEPTYNLAAYGNAYFLALVMEAPIIMLMSASTALCKNNDAFIKLRRFTYILNGGATLLMLILLLPPVFDILAKDMFRLHPKEAEYTYYSLVMLLPWPSTIGYRRFYQGIMVRFNLTRRVSYCTLIRLTCMATTAYILYSLNVTGAYLGAASLSVGVTCEAVVSRLLVHRALKELVEIEPSAEDKKKPLTYLYISKFYYPLALMTTLSLGVNIVVLFFIRKSRFAIESRAVLPVITSLGFLFKSLGLSYTEVVIALMGEKNEGYKKLRNFACGLGVVVTAGYALVAFTPLANVWFGQVAGLSAELTEFSILPTQILVFLPALSVLVSLQRAVLVRKKYTGPITWATVIEVLGIMAVLYICVLRMDIIGVVAAACAYFIGRALANIYFTPYQLRALKKL